MCDRLIRKINPTFRLLGFLGLNSYACPNITTALKQSDNPSCQIPEYLDTVCGMVESAIEYLCDAKQTTTTPASYRYDCLYKIVLRGKNLSHILILLYLDEWTVIESYRWCKEMGCKTVNIWEYSQLLESLSRSWNGEDWKKLTDCPDKGVDGEKISITITEMTYTLNNVDSNYRNLIRKVKAEILNIDIKFTFFDTCLDLTNINRYIEDISSL